MSSSSEDEKHVKCMEAIEKFKNENETLKRENKSLRQQLEDREDPAKKKILMEFDPFKVLNEYCIIEILKQLNGSDFYNITKISQLWKSIVESNKRAAEELEKFLTIEINSYDDVLEAVSDSRDIEYKHVIIKTDSLFSFNNVVTSPLESLSVHTSIEWDEIKEVKFPALRKMEIKQDYGDVLNWITENEFPILTDLTYIEFNDGYYFNEDDDVCFKSLSKLKRLHLEKDGYEESLNDEFEDPPFQLESLTCRLYSEIFCKSQAPTLKELKCYVLDFLDYQNLLLTLTNLEQLSIAIAHFRNRRHKAPFPLVRNYKITELKYGLKYAYNDYKYLESLPQVLTSLPELKTLVLYNELTPKILKAAARINSKLTKIICKNKTADLEVIYENLKTTEANNADFNKDIEIEMDCKLKWNLKFRHINDSEFASCDENIHEYYDKYDFDEYHDSDEENEN